MTKGFTDADFEKVNKQEPVALDTVLRKAAMRSGKVIHPLQRQPLTAKEIRKWWASENGFEDCDMAKLDDFEQVVRAVEGKHGIKEQP